MTPGDFICVPIGGQTGKLIRIGEWLNGDGFQNYEHAEILVTRTTTLGAYPGGAAIQTLAPPDYQIGWLWSSDAIHPSPAQRMTIIQTAASLKGTPYSALDYFAIAAHRLHVPGGPLLEDYVASQKHMICSQLVDYCYMKAGVHLFNDDRWPGDVTPEDLANVIQHPEGVTYD